LWRRYQDADLPAATVAPWAKRFAPRNGPQSDAWHGDLGAEQVRRSRQGYYGSVTFVDEQIGRIIEALTRRGLMEETLIIFFSDHGDMMGDHHLWRKSYPYAGSARVPMMVRWPEGMLSASRGSSLDQVVELRDVLPTFLDAAGAPPARPLDGRSLLPLIGGKDSGWRSFLDLEHGVCYGPENHWNALADARHKYIFHAFDASEQLFDLSRDPGELRDLAGDPSAGGVLREWRQRMVAHLAPRGDHWVRGGSLAARADDPAYSPNYPR
jgi:arylsulfatase A-like enzyme